MIKCHYCGKPVPRRHIADGLNHYCNYVCADAPIKARKNNIVDYIRQFKADTASGMDYFDKGQLVGLTAAVRCIYNMSLEEIMYMTDEELIAVSYARTETEKQWVLKTLKEYEGRTNIQVSRDCNGLIVTADLPNEGNGSDVIQM